MKIATKAFLFLLLFLFFFVPSPASAETVNSNCVIINTGAFSGPTPTLPPECGTAGGGPMAQKAVELARAQIGKPYVFGTPFGRPWASLDPSAGKTPSTFDCSGLTGWAWYWASGGKISMNGQTWWDWSDSAGNGTTKYQKFTAAQKSLLQPGDLLYWGAPGLNKDQVHHTAIYSGPCKKSAGNDCFIEAKGSQWGIIESHLLTKSEPMVGFLRPVLQ